MRPQARTSHSKFWQPILAGVDYVVAMYLSGGKRIRSSIQAAEYVIKTVSAARTIRASPAAWRNRRYRPRERLRPG